MKKFRKVLDGLTSSPTGSSSNTVSGSSSGSGAGGVSSIPSGGTAVETPREEIHETLTADCFQICKVRL